MFILALLKVVCLLVAIAYFTLAERKIMAAVQRRVGPNVVGLWGLLQPLADGLKLAGKEAVIPSQASGKIFVAAAMAVLLFALIGWTAIPFGMFDHSEQLTDANLANYLSVENLEREGWYRSGPRQATGNRPKAAGKGFFGFLKGMGISPKPGRSII